MASTSPEGRELLGVYESDKAIVRIYTGPMTDTPEKLRSILDQAAKRYADAIRRRSPEYFEAISVAADMAEEVKAG